jgi:hypothetical protein
MKNWIYLGFVFIFSACTKDVGKNPALAYNDLSLLDSCLNTNYYYYKNDPVTFLSGTSGAHGTMKLRFNSIANKALGADGKLPAGATFPEGSFVVKDIYSGTSLNLYAYMYKKSGTWIWGEIKPNKEIVYSVNKNPGLCVNCHNQSGNRDLLVSFKFH